MTRDQLQAEVDRLRSLNAELLEACSFAKEVFWGDWREAIRESFRKSAVYQGSFIEKLETLIAKATPASGPAT